MTPVRIIFNNQQTFDLEYLTELFKATFQTSRLSSEQSHILEMFQLHLQESCHASHNSDGEVLHSLERFLLSDPELENIHSIVKSQIESAIQNMDAYNPTAYSNPCAVYWPDPTFSKGPRSIYTELPFCQSNPIIEKNTPIGSAGSCFSFEIAAELKSKGFNYK